MPTFVGICNAQNTNNNSHMMMINYDPLWETMRKKNITTYALINKYNVASKTVYNLKHNKSVTMYTLSRLCEILDCTPNDIVKFQKE